MDATEEASVIRVALRATIHALGRFAPGSLQFGLAESVFLSDLNGDRDGRHHVNIGYAKAQEGKPAP